MIIFNFVKYLRIIFSIYIYNRKMIQINNINFSQKTIESIQIDSDDVKGVEVELQDNKFKLTIIKNTNKIIKEEINNIDIIHNEPEQDELNEEP